MIFLFTSLGTLFRIDSCEYNATEDLWHIKLCATDECINLTAEYIEYQKKHMTQSNITLFFGNLLIEMGEYVQAERYFSVILNTLSPNDEEMACIFFYFERRASAGKAINGLGVVYSELGRQNKAKDCFQRSMDLY
ncbi:unnamed protein product [Rotaria sordida]|uniref:Tetratricopeptide repeat protein n=1 Tax=Rotaria sordida TaxID=392033 RepID=A0A815EEI7_9BILA|nr:unnamed protein product [Rotaria sordida]CAF1310349.1 unnamed protein product [Rotaria sordida]CAF3683251.1 unnamed protein product [Rotaria sordida]